MKRLRWPTKSCTALPSPEASLFYKAAITAYTNAAIKASQCAEVRIAAIKDERRALDARSAASDALRQAGIDLAGVYEERPVKPCRCRRCRGRRSRRQT